jgi:hypothetical protein
LVDTEVAASMIAHLKALPFWERTPEVLWDAPAAHALDPALRVRLRAFTDEAATDLKGQDAALALSEVARREQDPPLAHTTFVAAPPAAASHYDRFSLLKRAFPRDGDVALEGAALVERVLVDPARRRLLRWALGARFFLKEWASDHDLTLPAEALHAASASRPSSAEQLRANALTAAEHEALQARAALLAWLLEKPPERFGLPLSLQDEALLPEFPDLAVEALRPLASRTAIARALPYIAAWCERAGVAPPPAIHAKLNERWGAALATLTARGQPAACTPFLHAVWALEQGPVYFGYATWSLAAELLAELQRTGGAATIAALSTEAGT